MYGPLFNMIHMHVISETVLFLKNARKYNGIQQDEANRLLYLTQFQLFPTDTIKRT